MPTLIISIEGTIVKELVLTKERTVLGRRPHNDVVMDNLAVSGEHVLLTLENNVVVIEDLNSTNGTFVNGFPIRRQVLADKDLIQVGKYRIRFEQDSEVQEDADSLDPHMVTNAILNSAFADFAASTMPAALTPAVGGGKAVQQASLLILNGSAAGQKVPLVKVVTTLGKPGVAVASITHKHHGFALTLVEGPTSSLKLNGSELKSEAVSLTNGDMVDLAGARIQFVFH